MSVSFTIPDKDLAGIIDKDLARFARQWRQDDTIGLHEPIDAFCDVMLRGGKRLRGTLAMQSYYAHSGNDDTVALGAARVFEIVQTSLLVVDDIADRSALRRGGPSAHTRIEAYAKAHNMKGVPSYYGLVQAMNVAYAGLHKATTELLNLPVDNSIARRACRQFHDNILVTINGQIDDIYNEATPKPVSEAMIESVLERKTAHYTTVGPLTLGAQLAGKEKLSDSLYAYSVHAGCAYQIADDIISTFGDQDQTGKGNNDDIREGKQTLLAHYALVNSSPRQKETLAHVLGNEAALPEQCDAVRDIFISTGAYDYAKERLAWHEKQALTMLGADSTVDPQFVRYLPRLIDYLVNRES